jgi:hypothetical protein
MTNKIATQPQFYIRAFECAVETPDEVTIVLRLRATAHARRGPRQLASFVYEIAADLERRSDEIRTSWAIVPDTDAGQIALHLPAENEHRAAEHVVNATLKGLGLV